MSSLIKQRYEAVKKILRLSWIPLIFIFGGVIFPPASFIAGILICYFFYKYLIYALSPCPHCNEGFFSFTTIVSGTCYSLINDTWKCNSCREELKDFRDL